VDHVVAGGLVINLIPCGSAAGCSDGALLVQLLVGGPFAGIREVARIIGTTTATRMRPRGLDAAVLSRAVAASAGDPTAGFLRVVAMICALDRGGMEQARVSRRSRGTCGAVAARFGEVGIAAVYGRRDRSVATRPYSVRPAARRGFPPLGTRRMLM